MKRKPTLSIFCTRKAEQEVPVNLFSRFTILLRFDSLPCVIFCFSMYKSKSCPVEKVQPSIACQ